MPEGDAVWRTAKRLHDALAGNEVTRWELRWGRLGGSDKRGGTVLEVRPRGKHLLLRLDDGWTLHSHLRMEGNWRVVDQVDARKLRDPGLRAVVGVATATALGRLLGMLDVLPTERESEVVGHLGPDLLGDDWDAATASANLARDPGREVGAALLDQRNLAGIGTIWCAETCFAQRVSPFTEVGTLSAETLAALVERAHTLLTGTLAHDRPNSTGNWRRPLWVYRQRTCPRCGGAIAHRQVASGTLEERGVYHCPRCQPT